MQRKTKIALGVGVGALALVALVGTALPTRAGQGHGWGHGGGHGGGHGAGALLEQYDGNDDGRLTQAEIDPGREAQLRRFDGNGDGQLTLEEYQALWLDAMRERMVRGFQAHDADGNATVTVVEFQSRFEGMVAEHDRNGDGALSRDDRPRHGDGPRGRMHGPDAGGPPDDD